MWSFTGREALELGNFHFTPFPGAAPQAARGGFTRRLSCREPRAWDWSFPVGPRLCSGVGHSLSALRTFHGFLEL